MSNFISFLVFAVLSFALGVVVGETYAPISRSTVQSLVHRIDSHDSQIDTLNIRVEALKKAIEHDGAVQPQK